MSENLQKVLAGLLRGVTADYLGGPVDLTTLGINAATTGINKLANTNIPQIEKPVGGSDWFAGETFLKDDPSPSYQAGRFTGNLLPGIGGMASKARIPKGQVNALYPGGSDDFLLAHKTYAGHGTGKELYHPSAAIMEKERPVDGFGDTTLVLNPKNWEPKTNPSVIRNRDFYSPRFNQSRTGGRVNKDAHLWQLPQDHKIEQLRSMANRRLSDRFVTDFSRAGNNMEGAYTPRSDDYLGRLGENQRRQRSYEHIPGTVHEEVIRQSPRFQSFEHFEKSPMGGKLLKDRRDPTTVSMDLRDRLEREFQHLTKTEDFKKLEYLSEGGQRRKYELMRDIAEMTDPELRVLAKAKTMGDWVRGGPLSPDDLFMLRAKMREIVKGLREVPSGYGEAKRYGYLPMNKETVGGVLLPFNTEFAAPVKKWADKAGVPSRVPGYRIDDFEWMTDVQNYVQRRK